MLTMQGLTLVKNIELFMKKMDCGSLPIHHSRLISQHPTSFCSVLSRNVAKEPVSIIRGITRRNWWSGDRYRVGDFDYRVWIDSRWICEWLIFNFHFHSFIYLQIVFFDVPIESAKTTGGERQCRRRLPIHSAENGTQIDPG
jgi:hypothetical protein